VWAPGANELWPELRQEQFDGMEDLSEAADVTLPSDDCLWQAAQGFWYPL
jgi:hypothetical protein